MKNAILCGIVFMSIMVLAGILFAQSEQQRVFLLHLSDSLRIDFYNRQAEAHIQAISQGLPVRHLRDDGQITELLYFEEGIPIYYITTNAGGAFLIKADQIYNDGGAGLSLSGEGRVLGIWDGGAVYDEHLELTGRVVQKDTPSSTSDHATHVAGTMIASGINAAAKGMSYEALLHAWDWNNDASEMAAAAAAGLNVSQHAYSTITGWRYGSWSGNEGWHWFGNVSISETEDFRFGFYDSRAQLWDEIAYHAPNYLIVKSAGNDRGVGPAQPGDGHYVRINNSWTYSTAVRDPNGGSDGYDCITRNGNAKNIITVGAVDFKSKMTSYSSWGPTDDGRVKPDIVAKGQNVYSTVYQEGTDYGYKSGTSMSSPMISGAIGLLLHHQHDLSSDQYLLSSTIKALILHSAIDTISGAPGPDYRFGWGLMDTQRAAEIMSMNATADGIHINEMILANGEEINIPLKATGEEPLRATIVWTDPPGTPVDNALNPPDLMLVNDLDMRIIDTNLYAYQPYILDPENPSEPATKGDNFRDNVEVIHIETPEEGELFTLNISHKGNLTGDSQSFSLIITGNQSITDVANPQNFMAITAGPNEIDLFWQKNPNENNVMIVWNETNMFGIPENGVGYEPGDVINGGGRVIYNGGDEFFSHCDLEAVKRYYYKAFSVDTIGNFSNGSDAAATTDCGLITQLPRIENFNASNALPFCWDIIDHSGNGQVWQFGTHSNGLAGTSGNYAFLNSHAYGAGNEQNTDLITPVFDFSDYTEVSLSFTHYFRQYLNHSIASLSYSLDGGNSWNLVYDWTVTTSNPSHYYQNFPELGGEPHVMFKWNYTGTYAWFWNIDDVMITGQPTETAPPEFPAIITLTGLSILPGESLCFDAEMLIITGGDGDFIVAEGAEADLIAGERILMLPGSHIQEGAGFHAYISSDGIFCYDKVNRSLIIVDSIINTNTEHMDVVAALASSDASFSDFHSISTPEGLPLATGIINDPSYTKTRKAGSSAFTVYPNPASNAFTIDFAHSSIQEITSIQLLCINGNLLKQIDRPAETSLTIGLKGLEPGIIFVRVILDEYTEILKLVKYR